MKRYSDNDANTLHELGYGMVKRPNITVWDIDLLGIPCGKLNIPTRNWDGFLEYLTLNISDSHKKWFNKLSNSSFSVGWNEWVKRIQVDIVVKDKENITPTLSDHALALDSYIFSIKKPKNFNRYGKLRLNREILPFFLADYTVEETNFAISHNFVPSDYGFLAFQQNRIDEFGGLDVIENLPEDILYELFS